MKTLSEAQLNRALLARQLLLERSTISIPAALEQLAGVQNQYAPNAYIRLWSCLRGFQREELTRAYESGEVVQGTLMRGTIHTVSARDYHALLAAIRGRLRAWARRVHRVADADEEPVRERLIDLVRRRLAGKPMRRAAFEALLAEANAPASLRQTIHTDAEVVRVPPAGTWQRRRADLYGLADDMIGRHEDVAEADGLVHLVGRYLRGFGPAAAPDLASFTGVPSSTLKPILSRMELRHFRDVAGRLLIDVSDAPLPPADAPAPVRFLPTWDAILLVHARRTGVLPERFRPLIFNARAPQSFPTVLVDGRVAGTWRFDTAAGRVTVQPFESLPAGEIEKVEQEAVGLADFHR
ncbi:MAG: winged helix DNA-binding domain-containing protein [Chloroflexota bacterium]|nr:winged helix DNA-binding domain-containing protein [Chloroflexota bacterium]